MDFEVQRCSRRCATTGRQLLPGESYCSALVVRGASVVRYDYAEEAWQGPPEGTLGWWKSRIPSGEPKRPQWAPNDVMLDLLEQWESDPSRQDMRYVLALLLVRRRVLRIEESQQDGEQPEAIMVYCPKREATYAVACTVPSQSRVEEIQTDLARLLVFGPD